MDQHGVPELEALRSFVELMLQRVVFRASEGLTFSASRSMRCKFDVWFSVGNGGMGYRDYYKGS